MLISCKCLERKINLHHSNHFSGIGLFFIKNNHQQEKNGSFSYVFNLLYFLWLKQDQIISDRFIPDIDASWNIQFINLEYYIIWHDSAIFIWKSGSYYFHFTAGIGNLSSKKYSTAKVYQIAFASVRKLDREHRRLLIQTNR